MAKKKAAARKSAPKRPVKKATKAISRPRPKAVAAVTAAATSAAVGPVTLRQAKSLAETRQPVAMAESVAAAVATSSPTRRDVAEKRNELKKSIEQENARRIAEYKAVMSIMKSRGVKGLPVAAAAGAVVAEATAAAGTPLQVFAEGDSWFDYPVPLFGGGVIPRLEKRCGIPILNLAKAGDEVRNMLGVEERKVIITQLQNGSPAGGAWDAFLFSGGGNDIVGNPMALWVQDFDATVPAANLLSQTRFNAALQLVMAGYEDLIKLRDTLSPTTHLIFHGYDFAIPDGRGICGMGPWLKPTFDLRGFPSMLPRVQVVNSMLQQFVAKLQQLVANHQRITLLNTQGTLSPVTSSWHNELHPSKDGFNKIADVFHASIRTLFPGQTL